MNKIEKLIEELCPQGVAFKEMWEVTIWDKRFNGVSKEKQARVLSFKHISAKHLKDLEASNGEIKLLATGQFDGWTTKELAGNNLNNGEVITIPSGGSANLKYYKGEFVDSGNILGSSLDNKILNLGYFYYYLLTKNDLIESCFRGSGVKHPDMPKILSIQIPIPPLAIQKEIVKILDNFTRLEAELEAELEARKKQYEYYREELLTFGDDVEWKTLGEVCEFMNGKGHEKKIDENGKYIVVNSKFVSTEGKVKKYSVEQISPIFKDDILMVMSDLPNGKALAKCFHVDQNDKYTLNQRICSLTVKDNDNLNAKYLFFILGRNRQLLRYDNGVDQTNLRKNDILKVQIPIPPLTIQKEIVAILDKFDTLINDISIGLPAEIAARKKQYEYYRNQLLTFKPLELQDAN